MIHFRHLHLNYLHYYNLSWLSFLCLAWLSVSNFCYAKPIILVVGDSLSAAYQIAPEEGWVALLGKKLKLTYPESNVINSSIVGDTTANGLQRLPSLLKQYQPDIVILELGGNDGLRGLPVQTIKTNLKTMITLSKEANARVLLIGMRLPPNYGTTYTQQFYDNYAQLSTELAVSLVPFLLDNVAMHPKYLFADRIHPTAQAQTILLENVWPYLNQLITSSP